MLTDKTRLTKSGMSMGTPAYMSPEQAQGTPAGNRSDIWSLGVVLYEMVTGCVPFAGEREAAVANAILTQDPEPMTALRTGLPLELDRIAAKALAKSPSDRYQHVEDMLVDLRTATQHLGVKQSIARDKAGARRLLPLGVAALGGAAIALLGAWLWKQEARIATPAAPSKFEVASAIGLQEPVISPNGRMIAYLKDKRIWIRQMDSLQPRELAGTDGAQFLFWSPDSLHLGYVADLTVRKVSAQGGAPVQLSKLPVLSLGAAWSPEGFIVVGLYSLGLFKVPEQGGEPSLLVKPDPAQEEFDFHDPTILPDGSILCATHRPSITGFRVIAIRGQIRTTIARTLDGRLESPVYSSGHVFFHRDSGERGLWAVPVDASTMTPHGNPIQIGTSASQPSVSGTGMLSYLEGEESKFRLVVTDRSGHVLQSGSISNGELREPDVSPDGTRIAVGSYDGNWDIFIHQLASGQQQRFTFSADRETEPAWSPNGKQIAFLKGSAIAIKPVDGSREAQIIISGKEEEFRMPRWSPAGDLLVYQRLTVKGFDLLYIPLQSNQKPVPFLDTPNLERYPSISPDGRYLAYTTDETQTQQIFVRSFPAGEGKWLVSSKTGRRPRWSPKGDELFFLDDNTMMAARIRLQPSFSVLGVEKLFDGGPQRLGLQGSGYSVMPDGKGFAAVQGEGEGARRIVVVENWLTEFQKKQ